MRLRLYNLLVNRKTGIKYRYGKFHANSKGIKKIISWIYLLWLNFAYYCLFCRFLGKRPDIDIYEEKNLMLGTSESEYASGQKKSIDEYCKILLQYDVITFDIFDTLILRPFSEPTDLFFLLGQKLGILDFKRIRMEQEALARKDCYKANGHYEVTLTDIWNRIEYEVGISAELGIKLEQELELQLCYVNPFMMSIYEELVENGKKIALVSDMYLQNDFLEQLLKKNGIDGYQKLYVSCEYGFGKNDGKLFHLVKEELGTRYSYIHIGDNEHSDVKQAKKAGFASCYYPNVNKMALSLRPYDMSPIIGGAYRGVVDNYYYQGRQIYSLAYEYGFTYGGLFAMGYCYFIHDYYLKNSVDKILFLSRDGDILKQVYEKMFPEDNISYVYWSRSAATKLMASYNRYDYVRRFIYQKVNKKISIRKILQSMELQVLIDEMMHNKEIMLEDYLTNDNSELLKDFILKHFDKVIAAYEEQNEAAKQYFAMELQECSCAVAVDIGWAGSGAMAISCLVEQIWELPCKITGIIAGTNTIHNMEPDASESFLQNGKLVSYMYSQAHNRDLMKKHDLNKDYNIYWELLLSSPTAQFLGFGFKRDEKGNKTEELDFHFGSLDKNQEGIKEIQRGILDFVTEYLKCFHAFPYMMNISGRDAYAPMLLATSKNEKYLKAVAKQFGLDVNVS